MRFEHILLIRVLYKENSNLYETPMPAGLGYIAKMLQKNGIEYEVIDISLGYTMEDIKRKIFDFCPDLVGVSFLTYQYKKAYQLINDIKQINNNLKIAVGGAHISLLREKVLKECTAIDYGVVLEGELTFLELCQGKQISQIRGLIYREDGNIIYNGEREFFQELDYFSFPTYDKFELNKYLFVKEVPIHIISSRGCPFECTYCPVIAAIGKKFRMRSASNVVDEIEYWYKKDYRDFNFLDDNFTLNKERVYGICDEIRIRSLTGLRLMCGNGVRADCIDRKLLARMKAVGFHSLSFGVEAANNKVLHSLKKGEDLAVIEAAIKDACELGYHVELFFLVGSPTETWADIEDSVSLAQKYPVADVKFSNIIPYPGTELFNWIKKNDFFIHKAEDYLNSQICWDYTPVFITPELSLKERKRALRYTRSIRKKIRRKNYQKRMIKYGFIGKVISVVILTNFVQNMLLSNRVVRKFLRRLKILLIPDSYNILR